MVQLGICAFRQGLIKDAHNALLDIQSSGRAKELLGQGLLLRSLQERNSEQEKVEKRRQVPFHMHVNLELLECVYLVSAMLLEIPYMAAHELDARRRMISKQFHHQLRVGERQPLLGECPGRGGARASGPWLGSGAGLGPESWIARRDWVSGPRPDRIDPQISDPG